MSDPTIDSGMLGTAYRMVKDLGFPVVVALGLLFIIKPEIDRGINVAERVDAQLGFLEQQHAQIISYCAPVQPRLIPPQSQPTP